MEEHYSLTHICWQLLIIPLCRFYGCWLIKLKWGGVRTAGPLWLKEHPRGMAGKSANTNQNQARPSDISRGRSCVTQKFESSARVWTGRTLRHQRKIGAEYPPSEMIAAVFLALVASVCTITSAEDAAMSRALKLMAETPLIDGWVETSASLFQQPAT